MSAVTVMTDSKQKQLVQPLEFAGSGKMALPDTCCILCLARFPVKENHKEEIIPSEGPLIQESYKLRKYRHKTMGQWMLIEASKSYMTVQLFYHINCLNFYTTYKWKRIS